MNTYLNLPAPAKLNLFLHVTGRKSDGMHLLESIFVLIDLCDQIDLEELPSGAIERVGDIEWDVEKDLCWRAAKLLQRLAPQKGCRITVRKQIPHGAGMGGGSSDAATCLIGLNRLWGLNLSRIELMRLGLELGADVPFFIFGQDAFAEGVGEVLTPCPIPDFKALVVFPNVSVPTAKVFGSPDLTRNTKSIRMLHFPDWSPPFRLRSSGCNDLEPVTRSLCPAVEEAFRLMKPISRPRMTGSGSAVFSAVELGSEVCPLATLPSGWKQWIVKSLKIHPLSGWIES